MAHTQPVILSVVSHSGDSAAGEAYRPGPVAPALPDVLQNDRALRYAVQARYAEAHRAYHTFAHVEEMLRWRQRFSSFLFHTEAVDLAIIFHDIVYEPGDADNERRSADLMHAMLGKMAAPATLDAAATLIKATHDHRVPDDLSPALHVDLALFLDFDLAVLGAPTAIFESFEAGIRHEFIAFEDIAYARGRREVLSRFLERPSIYHTDVFRDLCEERARRNIGQLIETLG